MKVRNILGISGGKDSAALAIYLKQKYPNLKIEYYNSDTGCELAETELHTKISTVAGVSFKDGFSFLQLRKSIHMLHKATDTNLIMFIDYYTTVPYKWINSSLKLLKYSQLHGFLK
jgi:7-cyano-7-deazaguanine synthase in queuosine biosynthesis